jgi:hypothetical protein
MNKKVTAIGLSAGLLAGLGAGLLLEQSGNAGATSVVNAAVAANTGATETTIAAGSTSGGSIGTDADRTARLQEVLQPLVDDGVITQEQADKVIAALEAAGPMGGHDGAGAGMPGGGMPGDGDGDGGRGAGMSGALDSVAALLGITTDELTTELQSGKTLATIATEHGATAQDVIDVLVQEVKDHFTAEVASGEHTQEDADARIADATQRITDFVNNGGPMGPGMGGRGGHGPGDGDHDGGMGGQDGSGSGSGGPIDGGPSDSTQTSTDA